MSGARDWSAWPLLRAGGVVVVVPHPDDETLGCGGLIAEAAARGCHVTVVLVTDGGASHPGDRSQVSALRAREMRAAMARLGGRAWGLRCLRLPDAGTPWDPRRVTHAVTGLRGLLRRAAARALFAPSRADAHADHRAAFAMAARAVRRTGVALVEYAVWGALPAGRRMRLRVRHQVRRRAALARHGSQLGRAPAGFGTGFVLPAALRAVPDAAVETFRMAPA